VLSYCQQDGYGVCHSLLDDCRLIIQADMWELMAMVTVLALLFYANSLGTRGKVSRRNHSCILSDFGCHVAIAAVGKPHV
jgi:hypothetical protein